MTLSGEVNDRARSMLSKRFGHQIGITDVPMHEYMVRIALKRIQIAQVAGIRQRIHVYGASLTRPNPMQHKVGTNEAGAACNEYACT